MVTKTNTIWKLGRKPRVCVVGSGVSGLICAERLGRNGVDVTILEARDRVGGRVHQVNKLGHWTDMGANWIHGSQDNPIRNLAKKLGSTTIDVDEATGIYDEHGNLLGKERVEGLEEVLWTTVEEAFKQAMSNSDIPARKSLKDFVTERVLSKSLPDDDKRLVLQLAEMWGGYIGSPYERQSLKYLFLESSLEGQNSFIASTYKSILEYVSQRSLRSAKIHYRTFVTAINTAASSASSVQVLHRPFPDQGHTTDTDEILPEYDATVVTVPFGCLQTNQLSFTPSLPSHVKHAIDSISYGNLEKVYLKFPRAFWKVESVHQPFFCDFLHPSYAKMNPKGWDIAMVNLSSSSFQHANATHPTLLFYMYGPCGTYVTEMVRELAPEDPRYLRRLRDFFQPYFSRLPNYKEDDPECMAVEALATDWQHDRLAGYGSYTNWQVDDNEQYGKPPKMPLDKAIETLRHGLPERAVWFAGEHTAPFKALGTVTGAYLSGEHVAERVLEHFTI